MAEPYRESEDAITQIRSFLCGGAIQPVGNLEELLVEKLAFVALRLSRMYEAAANVAPLLFDAIGKSLTENHSFAGGLI